MQSWRQTLQKPSGGNFRPYEPRLLLTTKKNQTTTLLPKRRRPLNVIHGSARFSKFQRGNSRLHPDAQQRIEEPADQRALLEDDIGPP
jgi:hypothetical protein